MGMYYAGLIPDNGNWSVLFPDFPGISTWGESPEQAFSAALHGLAGLIEIFADDGRVIPTPSCLQTAQAALASEYADLTNGECLPANTLVQLVPVPDLAMRSK